MFDHVASSFLHLNLLITTNCVGGTLMADAGFLQRAHCIHRAPEKVHDKRFEEEGLVSVYRCSLI